MKQTIPQVQIQVWDQVYYRVHNRLRDRVYNQVHYRVWSQVQFQVGSRVRSQVRNQVLTRTRWNESSYLSLSLWCFCTAHLKRGCTITNSRSATRHHFSWSGRSNSLEMSWRNVSIWCCQPTRYESLKLHSHKRLSIQMGDATPAFWSWYR